MKLSERMTKFVIWQGADKDEPEGVRFAQVSATLWMEIVGEVAKLERVAEAAQATLNVYRKGYLGSGMGYAINHLEAALEELEE
mgnify:CR=1 FL=1